MAAIVCSQIFLFIRRWGKGARQQAKIAVLAIGQVDSPV